MSSPHQSQAREADRIANRVCRRRLMHASLTVACAWLTYVNPLTLEVRSDASWTWLAAVLAVCIGAVGFALWSLTAGDRRAWMRAFHASTHDPLETASSEL